MLLTISFHSELSLMLLLNAKAFNKFTELCKELKPVQFICITYCIQNMTFTWLWKLFFQLFKIYVLIKPFGFHNLKIGRKLHDSFWDYLVLCFIVWDRSMLHLLGFEQGFFLGIAFYFSKHWQFHFFSSLKNHFMCTRVKNASCKWLAQSCID